MVHIEWLARNLWPSRLIGTNLFVSSQGNSLIFNNPIFGITLQNITIVNSQNWLSVSSVSCINTQKYPCLELKYNAVCTFVRNLVINVVKVNFLYFEVPLIHWLSGESHKKDSKAEFMIIKLIILSYCGTSLLNAIDNFLFFSSYMLGMSVMHHKCSNHVIQKSF